MAEIALEICKYIMHVISSASSAMLFTTFSHATKRWKTVIFAGTILGLLITLDTLPNIYVSSALMVLMFFCLSFLFRLTMPIRIFLVCCFWAAKDICRFISVGALSATSTIINESLIEPIIRKIGNGELSENGILTVDLQPYWNMSVTISAGICTVVYAVLLFFTLRFISKSFIYKERTPRRMEILFLILPCFSGVAATQTLRYMLHLSDETTAEVVNSNLLMIFLIPLSGVLLLLGMMASVKLYQNLIRLHMEETDKRVLEKQMVQIKEQVRDVQDVYGEIRGIRHDMANHLSNIRSLIQTGSDSQEEFFGYIGKLEDNLDALRLDCQTGNPITDVIIHQKMLETRSNGIDFEFDFLFPDMLNIDSVDIAVILSNSLDNALEACRSMQEMNGNCYIKLSAYKKGVMFFIEIENSFVGSLNFDENSDLPVSRKTDGGQHGIGLANIKRCAGKYFGDINISHGDGVFSLTVMLQGRA